MKIMLVDDHPGFRRVVKILLQNTKAEFVECDDGSDAVRSYATAQPDVVLMDIAMKGLDGIKATLRIRTAFPAARVFILTQYDDPDLRTAAREAGASGYFLKDDLSQVQTLVRSLTPGTETGESPI